eukprot:6496544-Pyramimonas_sp.AAC.2
MARRRCLMLVASALGALVSALAPDGSLALALGAMCMMFSIIPSGFTANLDKIPTYYNWMKDISFCTYSWRWLSIAAWEDFGPIDCSESDMVRRFVL